jgi:hypothetical protein
MEGRVAARLKKASHAGIIRIGFEGISQPRNAAEHPCFNDSIETLRTENCKWGAGENLHHDLSPKPLKLIKAAFNGMWIKVPRG